MALSLTRSVAFRASHRLADPTRSEAENRRRFGWTAEAHEHLFTCAATVTGSPDPRTGMLLDLALLDRILAEEVLAPLEETSLNQVVPAFAGGGRIATCEGLAAWLFPRIADRLPAGLRLERVRVAEDHDLYADCTGPA